MVSALFCCWERKWMLEPLSQNNHTSLKTEELQPKVKRKSWCQNTETQELLVYTLLFTVFFPLSLLDSFMKQIHKKSLFSITQHIGFSLTCLALCAGFYCWVFITDGWGCPGLVRGSFALYAWTDQLRQPQRTQMSLHISVPRDRGNGSRIKAEKKAGKRSESGSEGQCGEELTPIKMQFLENKQTSAAQEGLKPDGGPKAWAKYSWSLVHLQAN